MVLNLGSWRVGVQNFRNLLLKTGFLPSIFEGGPIESVRWDWCQKLAFFKYAWHELNWNCHQMPEKQEKGRKKSQKVIFLICTSLGPPSFNMFTSLGPPSLILSYTLCIWWPREVEFVRNQNWFVSRAVPSTLSSLQLPQWKMLAWQH